MTPTAFLPVETRLLEALAGPMARPEPRPARPTRNGAPAPPGAHDRYCREALRSECERVAREPEGGRNNALHLAAFRMGRLEEMGLNEDDARDTLLPVAEEIGLPRREAEATFRSGWEAGAAEPREAPEPRERRGRPQGRIAWRREPAQPAEANGQPPEGEEEAEGDGGDAEPRPCTEFGNGERLADRHGHDLRYCHRFRAWHAWDGRHWQPDDTAEATRRAGETARSVLAEAAGVDDNDHRAKLAKWALASESERKITAMLKLAAADPRIAVLPSAFDRDPWLFNCLNGTLELCGGARLREHRREDMITKVAPVAYDPDAPCPTWEATVHRAFGGNRELIGYWQRLCGLSLTGVVTEQILPILYGVGANGKSTLLNALLETLGPDDAMKAPPELLMARRSESHPTERASLFGKRLVVAVETGEGARLNEPLIEELTGSDKITARRMRENFWTFDPTHKVMLCTNHTPVVRGTDHALWRRLKLIPFSVVIPDHEQDKDLPRKLAAERPVTLAWCVRGCLEWQESGLGSPDVVTDTTNQYRREEDVIGGFLSESCVLNDTLRVKAQALYDGYRAWAERSGEAPVSQTRFGTAMRERGFERQTSNGTWYRGLALRQDGSGND